MLRTQLPITLLLLSFLSLGCTDSGTPIDSAINTANSTSTNPTSNGAAATGFNINGPFTGEIWTPTGGRFVGTTRFNLQTGEKITVADTNAFPTKDGRAYVEVRDDYKQERNEYCPTDFVDVNLFLIKDTRTGTTLGEFSLVTDFGFPVHLSPDLERVALKVSENPMECQGFYRNHHLTIMSKEGEQLYRHPDDSVLAYDWHPDGRLAILKVNPAGFPLNRYGLEIETEPGSYVFEGLLGWDRPADVKGYGRFRVSPNGKEAVMEEILDQSHFLSGVTWRSSRTRHFTIFEVPEETAMFVYEDEAPRVNAPTFSPDGQHILVVEGAASGAVTLNPTSLEIDSFDFNPSLFGTDELGTFSVEAVAISGSAYIVPASQKLQPMPPKQFSENIRPVLALTGTNNRVNAVSFIPSYDLTWTPVID